MSINLFCIAVEKNIKMYINKEWILSLFFKYFYAKQKNNNSQSMPYCCRGSCGMNAISQYGE